MTTLALNDLDLSQALDRKSMTELTGGEFVYRSSFISTGAWSPYKQFFSNYVGLTYAHDGYLSRQTYEGFTRSRTQTEYSYWDHFVRV